MNCAYCHTTRFGLARYQLLTKGYVYFDRKRCRDGYLKAIQGEELTAQGVHRVSVPAGADRQADATASQWG